ncbi:MAG TPA: hypothetical protein VFU21_23050 [Kofleriaceae bacterium]|nr:hypothetical protein [Kofleriaceae bacterium]
MRGIAAAAALAAAACGDNSRPPGVTIEVAPELADLVREWAAPLGEAAVVEEVDDPAGAAAAPARGVRVAVVGGLDCSECYEIEEVGGDGFLVRGDAPLGIQYGLAAVFEGLGFRFVHPFHTFAPPSVDRDSAQLVGALGVRHQPAVARRRGLHLHTLHPIEGFYAMWEPGDESLAEARRIVDWVVKNRGNYLQWVALDDILDPGAAAPWREHTRAIIDYAHGRGVEVGVGLQLFGSGSLQYGFDLVDDEQAAVRPQIEERLPVLAGELDWDVYSMSFGEFFGEDPDSFITSVNQARDVMSEVTPDAEMLATIHVGDTPEQRVTYMGEDMIYYFLVQFADPRIVPLVHTVMLYNLYEDAGGAYQHEDFAEHRDYILERLAAGERVGYHPETAYWIAFDDSVPIYLPLYVRSRWLDLDRLAADAAALGARELDEHILFSSGWEWGYWQNDWASLRASFERPARWQELFEHLFAPLPEGGQLAALAVDLTELQHRALLEDRLMPYLAARDLYIDLGADLDPPIVSQPDRVELDELAAMSADERAAFAARVGAGLDGLAAELAPLAGRARPFAGAADRVARELADGVLVTEARARFIRAVYAAALADLDGDGDARDAALADLDAAMADARAVVTRRHRDLHHPRGDRLVQGGQANVTLYQFGYLAQTDVLCYWEREKVLLDYLLSGTSGPVPGCIM